jgi:integrase-like protein
MHPLVGAGLPYSGPVFYWTAVAGDRDPGQRAGILRDRIGCVGWSARGEPALHPVMEAGPECFFIESFNGKFRDECLNEYWFLTFQEAQVVIEAWRQEYRREYRI